MTAAIMPILKVSYKPAKLAIKYKHRTIQRANQNSDLRILACFYNKEDVVGIVNLLRISNATRSSPIATFTLHLHQLTDRVTALRIVHDDPPTDDHRHQQRKRTENLAEPFEVYRQETPNVTTQMLSTISPFITIHEDICNLAIQNCVALILIPFRKTPKTMAMADETVTTDTEKNNSITGVHRKVLRHAPCSVGIFIDRGLGRLSSAGALKVVVFFFSGTDDREALLYGWRLAGHTAVTLTVFRFVLPEGADIVDIMSEYSDEANPVQNLLRQYHVEKQEDEQVINEFRIKTQNDKSVRYSLKVASSGEETVTIIKALEVQYDLYVVGKGEAAVSPLLAGMNEWSEYPELGPIGDMLASSKFEASKGSVVVVQQFVNPIMDVEAESKHPAEHSESEPLELESSQSKREQ